MERFMAVIKKSDLIKIVSLFFILFLCIFPQTVHAQDVKKIALLPFDVYSKTSAALLQEAVYKGISSELTKSKRIQIIDRDTFLKTIEGKRIDEKVAISTGNATGADYVVMGSLSEIGTQIGVDVRVVNIREGKTLPGFFSYGKGIESIGKIASQIRKEIMIKLSLEQKIIRIDFKGNRKIETTAINQVLKSGKGNLLDEADIAADIRAIYKMGYFDNVAADVTESPEGKIITFILQEKPLISEIVIKGNKEIDRGDIEGVIGFKVRQSINFEKIASSVEKIKALYDNKGYYNAEIKYEIHKEGDKDVRIVYNITENNSLHIKTIFFKGNRAFTDKELKKTMTVTEWTLFHFLTDSGLLKKDQLSQDISKINAFYLNNGYINAKIGEPEITHDRKWIYVTIPVVEGKQFKVGKVEITGDMLNVSRASLIKNLKIPKREFFDRESIIKDMEYLTQACNNEGHAYADVAPRTAPQEKDQTVDVEYHIKKGNLVYFNRISITGNTKTRDKVIRRQLAIVEGDLYNSSNLKKSYMELNRLRYFEEVNFQTEKGPDDTLTDINIQVKEKPTGVFSIGAGYSALDYAMVTASISQQNLFGRGQTLSLKASMGSKTTMYELSFIEPWLFDIPLWSKFDLHNYTRVYDTYDLDSKGFGAIFGYPLWEYITGYIGYRLNSNNVQNIQPGASRYIWDQAGQMTTSTTSVTMTRDTTDDVMFPSKGAKHSATIDYTGGFLGGDASFTRYGVSSAWFFPLPLDTVFAIRGRAGFLEEREGKKIPVYERFYLGGINSIRGLKDVGPVDPATGDVIGGLTMMNFNVEFIFTLIKNAGMKGVLFYDTGNAWESGYYFDDMRKTAGAGIRWYSPIGPLRLEWGYVLDRKSNEPDSRWEFTIGMFM
jgi:outer membrane protein insertion porin family